MTLTKVKVLALLFTVLTMTFSCCSSKKTAGPDLVKAMDGMTIDTYQVTSASRIKDDNKMTDTPYLYDLEVLKNTIPIDTLDMSSLNALIADTTSFLGANALPQCKPNPDFFIGTDNSNVYGFHLSSECPILLHLRFIEAEEETTIKYISPEKLSEFIAITDKILKK